MDDVRIGSTLRAIRIRKRLRQADVARRAGISREKVGKLERGELGRMHVDALRTVAAALGARVDIHLRWQGADVDRVVGAAHADLHESVAGALRRRRGWTWRPEVTYSIYGERGIIDILAWHAETRSLLIIELKTELSDPQDLVAQMHRRERLAREVARQQGWRVASVSTWVILAESSTNRRRVKRYSHLLRQALPTDGRAAQRWLRAPTGCVAALSFWSSVRSGPTRRSVGQTKRVRLGRRERSERAARGA